MQHGEKVELYFLMPNVNGIIPKNTFYFDNVTGKIFYHKNLNSIYRASDFLFYMRNIWGKPQLEEIWPKLNYFFIDEDYVDGEFNSDDIDLLDRFARYAPNSIENLKGYKLSEQIEIIKKFLDKWKDDPIVAISIIESHKIDKDIILDEDTALLLELSVRKKIINDTRGKVRKILNTDSNSTNSNQIDIDLNF
jgi:hypothetical protein